MNFIPSHRGQPLWHPESAPVPDSPASAETPSEPVDEVEARDDRRQEEDEDPGRAASHPAGRGWTPLSRDLGIPGEHGRDDVVAALGHSAVFTRELRVRFLDHLAFKGNARAAAARVGVSHETAYRKRRQDAAFAALWNAALVHARHYSESELATRALDGVEVPIWHRGELVGHQVKHDTRLMLAHIARLDKRVEGDAAARACAERFDEMLADYAGHEAPEGFAEAAEERDRHERPAAPGMPPTRAEYVTYFRGLALDAVAAGGSEGDAGLEDELEALEEAGREAGQAWDEWRDGGLAKVEAIVEGAGDAGAMTYRAPSAYAALGTSPVNGGGSNPANPSDPPPFTGEVSAQRTEGASAANEDPVAQLRNSAAPDRVTSVNPRDNCTGGVPPRSPYSGPSR